MAIRFIVPQADRETGQETEGQRFIHCDAEQIEGQSSALSNGISPQVTIKG